MDHIKGRKDVKHRIDYQGKLLYYWLRRNDYPKDFQVLCIMCNLAKHDNDVCPHQLDRIENKILNFNTLKLIQEFHKY